LKAAGVKQGEARMRPDLVVVSSPRLVLTFGRLIWITPEW
jgi:hypothetical protein